MSTIAATRSKTYDIVYIAVFAVIMAICSWISIPTAVPFTLQTFGVFVAVGVLGGKRGTLSILVFILLGAIGVPVFAGFSGGIGVLAGTTGGYIIGFLFSWRCPEKWFNTVDKAIQYKKKSGFITSATGRRHYLGEIFPTDVFLPLQEIKFENLTLFAPANPEAYLRHNYGDDYMTPPPDGKRESHFVKRLEL